MKQAENSHHTNSPSSFKAVAFAKLVSSSFVNEVLESRSSAIFAARFYFIDYKSDDLCSESPTHDHTVLRIHTIFCNCLCVVITHVSRA